MEGSGADAQADDKSTSHFESMLKELVSYKQVGDMHDLSPEVQVLLRQADESRAREEARSAARRLRGPPAARAPPPQGQRLERGRLYTGWRLTGQRGRRQQGGRPPQGRGWPHCRGRVVLQPVTRLVRADAAAPAAAARRLVGGPECHRRVRPHEFVVSGLAATLTSRVDAFH
ncbi:uncharacterized protein LOC119110014 [Pollicipes pollicipes]|uniref:uncharacterized protein LOC119110014 n=1 Tax=Pollicipes pollicipes TaxID=41117 RepID=UPI001884A393|nr:uncharacterized protein LOC119110014 [Pollicipes pollicipes]